MYPSTPKAAIRDALRDTLNRITEETGHDSVMVPLQKTKSCTFRKNNSRGWRNIPFEVLLDVSEFALNNTILKDFDGQLWRQRDGIPMGDPHSPGMAIGTCAYMERKFISELDAHTRSHLVATRYMDDIFLILAKNSLWDSDAFIKDFTTNCYFPPLKLEPGKPGTFLETSFEVTNGNKIRYWLKNDNQRGAATTIWRYAHLSCYSNFEQKKTTLEACLRKVAKSASDTQALIESGIQKIAEFRRLYYPRKMLWRACTTMGVNTRDPGWFRVRDAIGGLSTQPA